MDQKASAIKRNMRFIWETPGSVSQFTDLVREAGQIPELTLYSLGSFAQLPSPPLKGLSESCECITINEYEKSDCKMSRRVHNQNSTTFEKIEDPSKIGRYEIYKSRVYVNRGFIGDCYIEEKNPLIDRVELSSPDMRYFPFIFKCHDIEDGKDFLLYDTEYVSIRLIRSYFQTMNKIVDTKRYQYEVLFDFKEGIFYEDVWPDWILPIKALLSFALGYCVHEDSCIFYSKAIGAKFSDLYITKAPTERVKEPIASTLFVRDAIEPVFTQKAIESIMTRPSSIGGAFPIYIEALYGSGVENLKFIESMRLIEAAYADRVIDEEFKSIGLSNCLSGKIDFENEAFQNLRQRINELSGKKSGKKISFKGKLESLVKRYKEALDPKGKVNWAACFTDCKNLRNEEAHGTLVGGLVHQEYEKITILKQLGIILFELSILDLFGLPEEDNQKSQEAIIERSKYSLWFEDLWPGA